MPARWYDPQLICWGQVVVGVERVLNAPSPQHVGDERLVF
jgi:hypothetical protein